MAAGVAPVAVGVQVVCVEPGLVVGSVVEVVVVCVVGIPVAVVSVVDVVVVDVVTVDVVVVVIVSPPAPAKVTKVLSAETAVKLSTVDFVRK
jgi:hypothetical protein